MSKGQWAAYVAFNLLILGMVFLFAAAMWKDKPKQIIFTPDIVLDGSAND